METLLTTSNITFVLAMLAIIFTVYNYFRNPQEDLEKKQAVTDKEIGNKATLLAQKEAEGKATLLAQQVEWEKVANQTRFAEFGKRLDDSMLLAANHIHTVDVKIDTLIGTVGTMSNEITKLATIIDERVAKK